MSNEKDWKLTLKRRVTVLKASIYALGFEEVQSYLDTSSFELLWWKEGEKWEQWYTEESIQNFGRAISQRMRKQNDFGKQLIEDMEKISENFLEVAKEVGTNLPQDPSRKELKKRFEKFVRAMREFVPMVAIPPPYEKAVINKIRDFLTEKFDEQQADDLLQDLTAPPDLPYINREGRDLARITLKTKKEDNFEEKKALKDHWKKYKWLSVYDSDREPFELSYFKEKLDSLKKKPKEELKELGKSKEETIRENNNTFKSALKRVNPPSDLKEHIMLLRDLTFYRTWRIEMQSKAIYNFVPLFEKIADIAGLIKKELALFTHQEIENFLSGKKLPRGQIGPRQKDLLYILQENQASLYLGEEARNKKEELTGVSKLSELKELKGNTASPEKVQGKVRIVNKETADQMKEEEILVTTMTSPEYIPAIKRASAVITDEGGVLSHAAIISRELKVPCIIGTKNATEVLNNGDKVKVDAKKGKVEVIE